MLGGSKNATHVLSRFRSLPNAQIEKQRNVSASKFRAPVSNTLGPHSMDVTALLLSIVALGFSVFTFWFTVLRKGTVRSTRPSFVAFCYDFVGKEHPQAKIFLRCLLFSTAKRGWVIEDLFLRVSDQSRTNVEFSFWGHGDKDLVRGSGLFIPENGIVTNHHFNPVDASTFFSFAPGDYRLELIAKLAGAKDVETLWNGTLTVPSNAFSEPIDSRTAIYHNWSPAQSQYLTTVEQRKA